MCFESDGKFRRFCAFMKKYSLKDAFVVFGIVCKSDNYRRRGVKEGVKTHFIKINKVNLLKFA